MWLVSETARHRTKPGPRLLELQHQIAGARLHAVEPHFAAAELNHPAHPLGVAIDSSRNRTRKAGAKIERQHAIETRRLEQRALDRLGERVNDPRSRSPIRRGRTS